MNKKTEYAPSQFDKTIDVKLHCDDVYHHDGEQKISVRSSETHPEIFEPFFSHVKQEFQEMVDAFSASPTESAKRRLVSDLTSRAVAMATFSEPSECSAPVEEVAASNPVEVVAAGSLENATPSAAVFVQAIQKILRTLEGLPGVKDKTSRRDMGFACEIFLKTINHECVRNISIAQIAADFERSHVTGINARRELLKRLGVTSLECRTPEACRNISVGVKESRSRARRQRKLKEQPPERIGEAPVIRRDTSLERAVLVIGAECPSKEDAADRLIAAGFARSTAYRKLAEGEAAGLLRFPEVSPTSTAEAPAAVPPPS
jgi:hypothetical protein